MANANPLVAAYRAGQTTNEFAWYAEQAVVLGFSEPEARAQAALAELRAHVLLAVRDRSREILRDLVTEKLEGFRAQCHSEWFAEEWNAHHRYLQQVRQEFDHERAQSIDKLTGWVRDDLRELLKEITAAFDDQADAAFRLGYSLDLGIRPLGVCDHLTAPVAHQPAPTPGKGWRPGPEADERSRPLGDHSPEIGTIEPAVGWEKEIEARWLATLNSTPDAEVRATIASIRRGDAAVRRRAVEELDATVTRLLERTIERQHEPNTSVTPSAVAPRKQETRNDERDKFIYDEVMKGTLYKNIMTKINGHSGWNKIKSDQGIRRAARSYAEVHKLPPIPARRGGK